MTRKKWSEATKTWSEVTEHDKGTPVRFPVQMVLPNDEVEVPWGDVPSLPLEVIADTEPDVVAEANAAINWEEDPLYPVDPSHWSNYAPRVFESVRILDSSWVPRHPSSERFHEIKEELGDMHDEKSIAYGTDEDPFANVRRSEEWGVPPWQGAMMRVCDKIQRLQSHAKNGLLPFEAIEDAFRDIAVYSVIANVLYEQEQNVRP